jgi:hypothetical protein
MEVCFQFGFGLVLRVPEDLRPAEVSRGTIKQKGHLVIVWNVNKDFKTHMVSSDHHNETRASRSLQFL